MNIVDELLEIEFPWKGKMLTAKEFVLLPENECLKNVGFFYYNSSIFSNIFHIHLVRDNNLGYTLLAEMINHEDDINKFHKVYSKQDEWILIEESVLYIQNLKRKNKLSKII